MSCHINLSSQEESNFPENAELRIGPTLTIPTEVCWQPDSSRLEQTTVAVRREPFKHLMKLAGALKHRLVFRLPEWLEGICPSQLLRQTKGLLSRPSERLVFVSAHLCNPQRLFIPNFISSM